MFFHELGHYISFILNNTAVEHFGIKEIKIYRCPYPDSRFCGETTPIVPEYIDNSRIEKNRLSRVLTNSVYGCIFQTAYVSRHFDFVDCLKSFGKQDYCNFNVALQKYNTRDNKEKIFNLYYSTIEHLIENHKSDFDNLPFDELIIIKGEDDYEVNLDTLKKQTENFINAHSKYYFDLLIKIDSILNK